MTTSRLLLLLLLALLCNGRGIRAERSEATLISIARQTLTPSVQQPSTTHSRAAAPARPLTIIRRLPMLSVIGSDDAGFVVVSHDDRIRPILGYGRHTPEFFTDESTPTAPPTAMPCGLEWYLHTADKALQALAESGYASVPAVVKPREDVKLSVEPLLKTDWSQGEPFNDWVPTYTDDDGTVRHCPSGCAPTATVQIMYYHRHPDVGQGEVAYTFNFNNEDSLLSLACRFDTVHFDWDHIMTTYNNKRSDDEEANIAVARLVKTVGYAMKTTYGKDGSRAGTPFIVLRDHFGYSQDSRRLVRSNYSDEAWKGILFQELSKGLPVYYRGEQTEPTPAAHAFVVDGYDADGLVHINWGWGRKDYYDGFFDLDILLPNHSDNHYSESQQMTISIYPIGTPCEMTEVKVSVPGTLATLLPENRSLRLKVSGTLDASDLLLLGQLGAGKKNDDGLIVSEVTHLDLSDAILPDDALPDSAFRNCTLLSQLVLPSALRRIGVQAICHCTNLTEISIPKHVEVVGEKAFMNCYRLKKVTIEEGVRRIDSFAFNNCDSLRSLHLPASIDSLGYGLCNNCDNIREVTMDAGNPHFKIEDNCLMSADGKRLLQAPLTWTETVEIPPTVETVENGAFNACRLTHLSLPASVRSLKRQSVFFCRSLTSIELNDGLEEIGDFAFNGCSALTEMHLPASVATIGQAIFVNCTGLTHVDISGDSPLYSTADNMLFSKDGTRLLQQLAYDKEEYVVPASVTAIGACCFRYKEPLRRLTLPAGLREIGNGFISNCKNFQEMTCLTGKPLIITKSAFSGADLSQATLHVPEGSLTAYETSAGWELFGTVTDDQPLDTATTIRVVVPPLLKSRWAGRAPYNTLCPEYAEGKRSTVGCGALSTAQVMRFWRWPDHGIGQNTYTSTLNYDPQHTVELSADFANTTYCWDLMLDDYNSGSGYTDEQLQAVATLCYHLGVALNMHFGSSSPNDNVQTTILNRHFRYYGKRLWDKSDEEYAEVMRRELDAGRPVLFHGENESSSNTHTFVCDGYAEGGWFHFNFGNYGIYDGYYQLPELLTPDGKDYRYHHRIHAYDMRPYRGEIPTGTVELTVQVPGTLQQLVDSGAAPFATSLKVTGTLNGADLLALRRLAGRDEHNHNSGHILTDLDMSGVSLVPSDDIYWQQTANGVTTACTLTHADELPANCFRDTYLRRIVLPNTVKHIRKYAFYNCKYLTELDIGTGITTIDTLAVFNTGLQELVIPQQVTAIHPWAFGDSKRLKRLHLPAALSVIGYSAFNRSDSIELVTCDIEQPFYIPANVFSDSVQARATLRVPAGTSPLYRRTQQWRQFAHIEEQEGEPLPLPYMVTASWSQGTPYNDDCPLDDGRHSSAGCGAVAMAQILSYYRQPAQGYGNVAYHSKIISTELDVEADFDTHPFDWDNICDTYNDRSTDQQKAAVANLVFMTASAMKMRFSASVSSTGGFGSFLWGLQHFMHIAPTACYRNRKNYSTEQWTKMLDEQLAARHPVFYRGTHTGPQGENAGHIFVIDGRDTDGRYHFNFGHDSSQQDKFTDIGACNQGGEAKAGNCYASYHHRQAMMTDCFPVSGLTEADYPRCTASLTKPFVLEDSPAARRMSVTDKVKVAYQIGMVNFSADSLYHSLGFYRDGVLQELSPTVWKGTVVNDGYYFNINRYFKLPEGMADGDYEMAAVAKTDADAPWLRIKDDVPNSLPVTVSGNTFTFIMPDYHNGPTRLYLKEAIKEIAGAREGGHTLEFSICNPSTNNFEDSLRVSIRGAARQDSLTFYMPTSIYDGQTLCYRIFVTDDSIGTSSDYTVALFYHDTPTGQWLPLTTDWKADGDVNGDGTVDVADIAAVISIMAGEEDTQRRRNADVNGDGTVDVADIAAVISIMAKAS